MATKYKPCPKCKSSFGYGYSMWVKYFQSIDLNGNEISAEDSDGKENKMFECLECHSRFRKGTLKFGSLGGKDDNNNKD